VPGPSANPLSEDVGVACFHAELQFAGNDVPDRERTVRLKADTAGDMGRPAEAGRYEEKAISAMTMSGCDEIS
jgi:hypothetical protein